MDKLLTKDKNLQSKVFKTFLFYQKDIGFCMSECAIKTYGNSYILKY